LGNVVAVGNFMGKEPPLTFLFPTSKSYLYKTEIVMPETLATESAKNNSSHYSHRCKLMIMIMQGQKGRTTRRTRRIISLG
jgi:hypothetical protein